MASVLRCSPLNRALCTKEAGCQKRIPVHVTVVSLNSKF